jgi:hypothetical protein
MLAGAMVCVAGGIQSAHATLVASFQLDGNTDNGVDPSNNGVVQGTTQFVPDQNGAPNGAFLFDGSTFIKASASPLPTGDRTVFLWFNATTVSTRPVLLGYGGGACGTSLFVGLNVGTAPGDYYVGSHCEVNRLTAPYGTDPSGQWHRFAVTTDSSGTDLYVDGSLIGSNSNFISNTNVAGTDLALGVDVSPSGFAPYTDVNVGFFIGAMDDVCIYNTALTADQIAALTGCGAAPRPVPEPASLLVLLGGLIGLRAFGRRPTTQTAV